MKQSLVLFMIILSFTSACSVLTLQPANFSWPIESVLPIDEYGNVVEDRYSLEFNTVGLFYDEFEDSLSFKGKELRLIRNNQGLYFITAPKFKNVYIFRADEGKMVQTNKIFISEFGLQAPAFNQRNPYIELVDGNNKMNLSTQGIEGGAK